MATRASSRPRRARPGSSRRSSGHAEPGGHRRPNGALDEAGAAYELLPHAHTESALREAEALGLSPDDVAKTLIVKTLEGYLRAVVPASGRLDERKVRDLTGGSKKDVHLATEDDLRRDYPDFDLGAVPPLGGARRDR